MGSTFWFTARLQRAEAGEAQPVPTDAESPADALRAEFSGRKVLLVEDHPVNQEVASHILGAVGLEATRAIRSMPARAGLRSSP